MKSNYLLKLVLLVGSVAAASPANASLVLLSDKSTFLGATAATDATGALPNLGLVGTTATTVGSITFSGLVGHSIFIGTSGHPTVSDWTTLLPGNDLAINDTEDLNVSLASLAYSFGFDFAEPSNPTDVDSTFTVTLLNGLTTVGLFNFNAPNNIASFVGVWSDIAFNKVQIRETSGGIDNEYFGRFYTGQVAAPVPEPATYLAGAMLLLPLAFGAFRKMRQN